MNYEVIDNASDQEALSRYPSPQTLVDRAFALMHPDGSIDAYDELYDEHYTIDPCPPVSVYELHPHRYDQRLYELAVGIQGAVARVVGQGYSVDQSAELLAMRIAAYRDHPEFVAEAMAWVHPRPNNIPLLEPPAQR